MTKTSSHCAKALFLFLLSLYPNKLDQVGLTIAKTVIMVTPVVGRFKLLSFPDCAMEKVMAKRRIDVRARGRTKKEGKKG